jgi:hypothetical protein
MIKQSEKKEENKQMDSQGKAWPAPKTNVTGAGGSTGGGAVISKIGLVGRMK